MRKFNSSNTDMSIVVWENLVYDLGRNTTYMHKTKSSNGLSISITRRFVCSLDIPCDGAAMSELF